jgi:hypothetical protein
MKHLHSTTIAVFCVAALALATSSCGHDADAKSPTAKTEAPVPPPIGPTAERAVQRSQERWADVSKGDLVAAYDLYVPEAKRAQTLASFLTRMQVHKYEDPRVDEVVGVNKDEAYLRVSALWTPLLEQTKHVKLEPGQSLTQRISMIETWRFVGGDWCYMKPDEEVDFFQAHPEFLKHGAGAPSDTSDAHKPSIQGAVNKGAQESAPQKTDPKQSAVEAGGAKGDAKAH